MPRHLRILSTLLGLAVIVLAACGEEEFDQPSIFDRPDIDAGASDASDASDSGADTPALDPRCQDLQPGSTCDMTNATGVCVAGQCQFLSCASGFRSCDDDTSNGCETDITRDETCGTCGASCTAPESCQLSRAGWVCSVAPVCPEGTYDLDGDPETGCEWESDWAEDGVLSPPTLRPDIAVELPNGAFALAGNDTQARLVTSTQTTRSADALPVAFDANEPVRAHDAVSLTDGRETVVAVAWTDAVTLSSTDGSTAQDGVFEYACEDVNGATAREFRAVTGAQDSPLFVATTNEVLRVGRDCLHIGRSCTQPSASFGQDDYLAAFYPGADASCGGCTPSTSECPVFEPVDVQYLPVSGDLLVVTRRGFIILERSGEDFAVGTRFEAPADDGVPRYVTGAAVEDASSVRVHLLDDASNLHSFVVDDGGTRPIGPAVGLSAAADSAQLTPGPDGSLLVTDARRAWLVHPKERSARIEALSEPEVFLGDDRILFGAGYSAGGDEFSLLYHGVGRYYLRDVAR